jgi:hypothetical protein
MVLYLLMAILALGPVLFGASVRVVTQFERGIVVRFGRLSGTPRGPSLTVITPVAERLHKANLQIVAALIRWSEGAALVVVGSRARGTATGKATADEHAESGRRTALPGMDPLGIVPVHRPRTPWE